MATIRYLKGDATQPQAKGNRIIAHVCNDLGGRGKGFVLERFTIGLHTESIYS